MFFTEPEATKMTCPTMSYCSNELGVIQDGDAPIMVQSNCIGSACMAWRWANPEEWERNLAEAAGMSAGSPVRGYCGLAGRPEPSE